MNPEPVLKDMFRFILAEENLENTIIEKRIKDVVGNGQNYIYKPRSASSINFHKFTDAVN